MSAMVKKIKQKSLSWWASVTTILAFGVALVAWLIPTPLEKLWSVDNSVPSIIGKAESIPAKSSERTRILVTKFDDESQSNYKVTDLIIANLRNSLSSYPDTEVLAADVIVTEGQGSDVAKKIGEAYDANIVIWGWYGVTDTSVPLGVHFEVLYSASQHKPYLFCPAAWSEIRKMSTTDLDNLTLQTDLSDKLSTLTLFTMGLSRYQVGDWDNAITLFDNVEANMGSNLFAVGRNSATGKGLLLDKDVIYLYRGNSYEELGKADNAVEDYKRLPETPLQQLNLGTTFANARQYQVSVEYFDNAIKAQPETQLLTILYYRRGLSYYYLGKYDLTKSDFDMVIKLGDWKTIDQLVKDNNANAIINEFDDLIAHDSDNALAHYLRGRAYNMSSNHKEAFNEYTKALQLNPILYGARSARATLYMDNWKYSAAAEDFNVAFQEEIYKTPCALQNRGLSYFFQLDLVDGIKDRQDVIELTTREIEANPSNSYAYFERGVAYVSLGNPFVALRDFFQAEKINPNIAESTNINEGMFRSFILMIVYAVFVYSIVSSIKDYYKTMISKRHHKRHHTNKKV